MDRNADDAGLPTSVSAQALALARAQAYIRRLIPEGVSLSEDLIAERRAEGAREEEELRGVVAQLPGAHPG